MTLRHINDGGASPFRDEVGIAPANDRRERERTLPSYTGGASKRLQDVGNCLHGQSATLNVVNAQEVTTISEADAGRRGWHSRTMLSHSELVAELRRLMEAGVTTQAKMGRIMGIPSSRVADIFSPQEGKTPRSIKIDEAKKLIEALGINEGMATHEAPKAVPISADAVEPLLKAVLDAAPEGKPSDSSLRALSSTLAYGLQLIGGSLPTPATPDALQVAVRGVKSRSRDQGLQ